MIQTVSDVVANQDEILGRLNKQCEGMAPIGPFDVSVMDGIVVWPNSVASHFLECVYRLDTNVVPDGLPGCGMATGDFFDHEGGRYVTVNGGVMGVNAATFYMMRRKEQALREWHANLRESQEQVVAFLAALPKKYRAGFPKHTFENAHQWRETYAGWNYVGAPDEAFVNALRDLPIKVGANNRRMQTVLEMAARLELELRPYVELTAFMSEIRREFRRKGIPICGEDMFSLSSPAASGGASIHTNSASDDVGTTIPNQSTLMIVGGQTDNTPGFVHVGGGNVKGEHYTLAVPKTPFFSLLQERVDGDEQLREQWAAIEAGGHDLEQFLAWDKATGPIKGEVIKATVPNIIGSRVLGFYLDLISTRRIARLHPVIAESALGPNEELIQKAGWQVNRPDIKGVLLEVSQGYHLVDDTLFAAA